MKTIIAIVGQSGSGKTLFQETLQSVFSIKPVQSHTTRPKRFENESCHVFVTDEQMDGLQNTIAHTIYGGYRYAGVLDDNEHMQSYVIDEYGLDMLLYNKTLNVVSVLIKVPEEVLASRICEKRLKREFDVTNLKKFDYIYNNIKSKDEYIKDIIAIGKDIIKDNL